MDRLNAMRVFVTVVDLGSQSAAADHLQLSRPVVSRYLAELEDWVGARLMQRTTRKLSLTAAGQKPCPLPAIAGIGWRPAGRGAAAG